MEDAHQNLNVMEYQFRLLNGVARAAQEFANGRAIEGGLIGWSDSLLGISDKGKARFIRLLNEHTDLKGTEPESVYNEYTKKVDQQLQRFSKEVARQHGVGSNLKHIGKDILLAATGAIPIGHLLVPIRKDALALPGASTTLSSIAGKRLDYPRQQQRALIEVNQLIGRLEADKHNDVANELAKRVREITDERGIKVSSKFRTTLKDLDRDRGFWGKILPGDQTPNRVAGILGQGNSKDFPAIDHIPGVYIAPTGKKGVVMLNAGQIDLRQGSASRSVPGDLITNLGNGLAIVYNPQSGGFNVQDTERKYSDAVLENVRNELENGRSLSNKEMTQSSDVQFHLLHKKLQDKYPEVSLDPYEPGSRIKFNGQAVDFTRDNQVLRNFVQTLGNTHFQKCVTQCHQILELKRVQDIYIAGIKTERNAQSNNGNKIPGYNVESIPELERYLPQSVTGDLCHRIALAIPAFYDSAAGKLLKENSPILGLPKEGASAIDQGILF